MTKPRRPRLSKEAELTANEWAYLCDAPCADETRKWEWWALGADCASFREDRPSVIELWEQYAEDVLAEWIGEWPGTRPSLWWCYSAPRAMEPSDRWFGKTPQPEPRRRLGGIGTPCHECLAHGLHLNHGIPAYWIPQSQVDYYNGRKTAVNVRVMPESYKEGDFPYPAIDPEDPPAYESEATYLDRHGLFLPGERERLTEEDFEPEAVMPAEGE